jgi:hypothetical protein
MGVYSLSKSSINNWVKYPNVAGGNGQTSDLELIATQFVTSPVSSLVFNNLQNYSQYKHLQLKSTLRTTSATTESDAYAIRFNGDAGANYSWHFLGYTGSLGSATSAAATSQTYAWGMPIPGANFTTSAFGVYITDILDAFSTVKNKTVRTLCGYEGNAPRVYLNSAGWFSTSSITSITITTNTGANFATGTRVSLYGVK